MTAVVQRPSMYTCVAIGDDVSGSSAQPTTRTEPGAACTDVERALRIARRQRDVGAAERRVNPAAGIDRVDADLMYASVELADQSAEPVGVAHARVRGADVGAIARGNVGTPERSVDVDMHWNRLGSIGV